MTKPLSLLCAIQLISLRRLPVVATLLVATTLAGPVQSKESWLESIAVAEISGDQAELHVEIIDSATTSDHQTKLPGRITVTDSAGRHPDGSGRGVYADGRFFVDGEFKVLVPVGQTRLQIKCGPHFVPLEQTVDAVAGQQARLKARMVRWFDPQSLGWL